jgi:hypothetical protein
VPAPTSLIGAQYTGAHIVLITYDVPSVVHAAPRLVFGIHPGVEAGSDQGLVAGAPDGTGDFWQQFGLLRDDYTPKPAFARYARLVAELGTPDPAEAA